MEEHIEETEVVETEVGTTKPKTEEPEKKYTDADVDRIINKRFARWQKEQEEKAAEAKRLAELSAEERANEQIKKLQAEINDYKKADAKRSMQKQVKAELSEAGLTVDEGVASLLVRDTAEATKEAIDTYIKSMKEAQSKWETEFYKGNKKSVVPPTDVSGKGQPTREQILKMPYAEHVAFKRNNPDLYNKIMNN